MGKKNKPILKNVIIFSSIVYLIVDVLHFFHLRIVPELTLPFAYYENYLLSALKWFFLLIIVFSLLFKERLGKLHLLLLLLPTLGIFLMLILTGKLAYMVKGSFVFSIGLLEITGLLTAIYIWKEFSRNKQDILILLLLVVFIIVLMVVLLPRIPPF